MLRFQNTLILPHLLITSVVFRLPNIVVWGTFLWTLTISVTMTSATS